MPAGGRRLPQQRHRLLVPARAVQRPAERVGHQHALAPVPLGGQQPYRLGRIAVVGLIRHQRRVDRAAVRGGELHLTRERRQLLLGLVLLTPRQLQLRQLQEELGQRSPGHQLAVAAQRLLGTAGGGGHPGLAGLGVVVVGGRGERPPVVVLGLGQRAVVPGEITQPVLAEGGVAGRAGGRQGALQGDLRLLGPAVRLQVVRGPGVSRYGGGQVEQALGGGGGGRVVAELDLGVRQHQIAGRAVRCHRGRLLARLPCGGELVAGVGEHSGAGQRAVVGLRLQGQRALEGLVCVGEPGAVQGEPGGVQVGQAQLLPGGRVLRAVPDGGPRRAEAVRRGGRGRDGGWRAERAAGRGGAKGSEGQQSGRAPEDGAHRESRPRPRPDRPWATDRVGAAHGAACGRLRYGKTEPAGAGWASRIGGGSSPAAERSEGSPSSIRSSGPSITSLGRRPFG